jgi:cysteinyl-tRNA synthetase
LESTLKLFNTMKGAKEPFRPLVPGHVTMFVCGPTVQSRIHLGHARTYIFYDSLARYLKHRGLEVFFLMNITDIDDSIVKAARQSGEDPLEYSKRMASHFIEDLGRLKVTTVSRFEPVSRHIEDMRSQLAILLRRKFAYRAGDWVYFDVSKFKGWGKLSHQSKRELSMRPLELSPKKKNLTDFALWRPEAGDRRSPWGPGSPGWHLQDTAVTLPIIGPQYDIHGGASELVYPHHEAQIALAESVTGVHPLAKYWVHSNLVNMKGRKMSKSVGNVVTVKDALKQYSADELRFFFLSVHHREEMSLAGIDAARRRFAEMRLVAERLGGSDEGNDRLAPFESALNDDFDSPRALRWSEKQLKTAAKEPDAGKARELASLAVSAMRILGVDLVGSS